ncbi:hypothetical protein [Candidatus Spongiihabitans sp.]|uniref:hypothetical protein n=1 Tax=Candidatus Spongiihabitans sp. TaxID=3101308 RepID=UPI003C7C0462
MPGPYYYYWPGNPVIKPFGVAELLIIAASPRLDSRLPARMTAGRMRSQTFFLGYFWHLNSLLSSQFTIAYHLSLPGPYYYWPGNPVEYAVRRGRTPS